MQHQLSQPDANEPDTPTTQARLNQLIHDHQAHQQPRLHKLWQYYRNPDTTGKLAQTQGLPPRLATDPPSPTADPTTTRETVIENDIAWRIHALVDFMVGQPVRIRSQAEDRGLAQDIDAFLNDVFTQAGGPLFFQELILLGSIYGHVDILLDASPDHLDLAPIPATRGIPDPHPHNLRQLHTYLLHHTTPTQPNPLKASKPADGEAFCAVSATPSPPTTNTPPSSPPTSSPATTSPPAPHNANSSMPAPTPSAASPSSTSKTSPNPSTGPGSPKSNP